MGSLIIAGLIAALGSWRLAFLAAGLGTMACGALAWWYIRNHPHEHESVNHHEQRHIREGLEQSGSDAATSVPFGLAGGQLLDYWLRRSGRTQTVYRWLFGISAGLATVAVFLVAYVHDEIAVIALLATTLFFLRWCGMYWTLPGLLIGGQQAGFLAGWMNFAGNISGIVVPVTVGLIISATGSYYLALMVFAAAGAGLFLCSVGMRYRRAV